MMSFSDPLHPIVQQEFTGVTATARDEKRRLIFLADSSGVWILHLLEDGLNVGGRLSSRPGGSVFVRYS